MKQLLYVETQVHHQQTSLGQGAGGRSRHNLVTNDLQGIPILHSDLT